MHLSNISALLQGWTDNDIFRKLKADHRQLKGSSLTLPPVKRDDDYTDKSVKKGNIKTSNLKTLPVINNHNSYKGDSENTTMFEDISTFDKIVNISTNRNKRNHRKNIKTNNAKKTTNSDKIMPKIPDGIDSNINIDNKDNSYEKKPTPEAKILRLTGGVELVPLLARRRRVGARTLPSSDVTRPPEQACQWREMLDLEYLRELKHQMQVKCERKEEKRLISAESVRQHHATWESLWGRPGHGAPQLRGRYSRNNLAQLLYVAPLSKSQ